MSLRRRPHTLVVELPEDVVRQSVINGHEPDPQGTVEGLLYGVDSGTMLERFGVDTQRGSVFLCNPGDAPKFVEGGRVSYAGKTYAIKSAPVVIQVGSAADNASVPLEEID